MKHNCNICGYPADVSQLHPNFLELPTDGSNYSVAHTRCANGEDRWNATPLSEADMTLTDLMSVTAAAEKLDVTPQHLYALVSKGILQSVKFGGKLFLLRAEIEKTDWRKPVGRPKNTTT